MIILVEDIFCLNMLDVDIAIWYVVVHVVYCNPI